MPDIYYAADVTFMQYIQDFVTENKNKVMKRKVHPKHGIEVYLIALFTEYLQEYAKPPTDPKTGKPQIDPKTGQPMPGIVQANEARKIQKMQKQQQMGQLAQGPQGQASKDGGKDTSQHKQGKAAMPGAGAPMGA